MYKDISHDERKEKKKKHSSMLLQGEHERKKEEVKDFMWTCVNFIHTRC